MPQPVGQQPVRDQLPGRAVIPPHPPAGVPLGQRVPLRGRYPAAQPVHQPQLPHRLQIHSPCCLIRLFRQESQGVLDPDKLPVIVVAVADDDPPERITKARVAGLARCTTPAPAASPASPVPAAAGTPARSCPAAWWLPAASCSTAATLRATATPSHRGTALPTWRTTSPTCR